jgi:hypothetical protein
MIDWSKLKPYNTDQKRSFEELCYQVARVQFEELGTFTSVDDSGGGDGVEFYLTLPNGEEWGWQAKFYMDGRLSTSRKNSIIGSLKKSCIMHPNLKKWFLCVPQDLTVGENDWFQNTLPKVVPEEMDIEFIFWGNSYFNHQLADPRFAGRKNYFFGELELTLDWFKNQVSNQLNAIKGKYNPSVHTETQVDESINSFLMNDKYRQYLISNLQTLKKEYEKYTFVVSNIEKMDQKDLPISAKTEIMAAIQNTNEHIEHLLLIIEIEIKFLMERNLQAICALPISNLLNDLIDSIRKLRVILETSIDNYFTYSEEMTDHEKYQIRMAGSVLWEPTDNLDDFLHEAQKIIREMEKVRWKELFIFGNAGFGKTHVSAHICHKSLEKELPIIFIPGKNITDQRSLIEQLRGILDIPSSYSWNDFLQALDIAANVFRTKIPIFIDGLNEVRDINVLKNGLPSLLSEVSRFHNIALIATCRSTYRNAIWGKQGPENRLFLNGFQGEDLEEAVDKYFHYYKILADTSSVSLSHFMHPLYLQIFCQTQNPSRQTEKRVYINEQSMFDVLNNYLHQCDVSISEKLGFHPRRKLVLNKIEQLGKFLWENRTRFLPWEEASKILDGDRPNSWENTLEKHLMDENLLIYRDWKKEHDEEVISFTYDLLGGYVIASYVLQHNKNSLAVFFQNPTTISFLFGEEMNMRHPLYEDINRCLAALLPIYTGIYLVDYYRNKVTMNVTVRSWFEMSPEYVNEKALAFIKDLFNERRNRKLLLLEAEKTMRQVRHPLNIHYWSNLLLDLSMPERDICWTENIRKNQHGSEKLLEILETRSEKLSDEEVENEKDFLILLAENAMWILTTTVRPLRDCATRALYYFGKRFPEEFWELLKYSFTINDPYISERMLAALYGITMARQFDFKNRTFINSILPIIARSLLELMFKDEAVYSTTHIMARDYAKRTIDIALIHHPTLLTEEEKEASHSPFEKGKRLLWEIVDNDEISEYGGSPIRMDFGNYTLGRLVQGRSNYDYSHREFKEVRASILWRIYHLGYSSELFEKIDEEIEGKNYQYGRSSDGRKTDRYGKKYSWIAFYEMAGYRKDLGLLEDEWDVFRISDIDIDPSFPKEVTLYHLLSRDFLLDQIPINEWLFSDNFPNIDDYLILEEINGEKGPWILIDGYFSDENVEKTRSCFFFPRGLLVKSYDHERIFELLQNQDLGGRWLPEIPDDHYVYAGEIPWADTFLDNDEIEIEFVTSKLPVQVAIQKQILKKNGKELSKKELSKIINLLIKEEKINWFQKYFLDEINYSEFESYLANLEISLEKRIVMTDIEKEIKERFQVTLPVRENSWDETRSAVNPSRNVAIPSKAITNFLGLVNQPQTFDLFDQNGAKASITVKYGDPYRNMQKFTYLRKDLLDKYLAEKDLKLIWALWGEKEISYKNEQFREQFLKLYGDVRKNFQEIILYQG